MKVHQIIATGAAIGALAVMIGAFGAHSLESTLVANGRVDTFQTAARYQMYHAIALVVLGLLQHQYPNRRFGATAWLWLSGVLLFCGALYTLALTNITILGAVAPLGGLGFMAGWLLIAISFLKNREG